MKESDASSSKEESLDPGEKNKKTEAHLHWELEGI